MIVGNGFHEVRGQSDSGMVEIFRGYEDAGILLLFTEESALFGGRPAPDRLEHLPRRFQVRARAIGAGPGSGGAFPPFGAGRGPACQLDGMRDAGGACAGSGPVLPGSDDLRLHAAQRPQPVHLGEPLLRTGPLGLNS